MTEYSSGNGWCWQTDYQQPVSFHCRQTTPSWENGSLEEAIARFAPDSTPVYTDKGKVIYRNETTGIEIIYDKNGNYFRINDTTISGKRSYLN